MRLQGLELLSSVLRSRGNEFDADVMMRCSAFDMRSYVGNTPLRRAASIMMAFGTDSKKKELEGVFFCCLIASCVMER